MHRPLLLPCLLLLSLLAPGLARAEEPDDCRPGIHERRRPAAPCLDRGDNRLYTARLDWPWKTPDPPASAVAEMKRVAALLQAHPAITRVLIEAHEADLPGRQPYGRCVTCNRARALRDLLLEAGVDGARIVTRGYGEVRPLFDTRDPAENRFNDRFEWHLTFGPQLDRAAVRALAERWRGCFEDAAAGVTLITDPGGRLATIMLDRPGPLRCMASAIGAPLADGPLTVRWPAPDRPAPFPPGPTPAPRVDGWACPAGTDAETRPAKACVSVDGTRIWLPALPRSPKSTVIPRKAYPTLDTLVALLSAAPQIARIRIEMHDYRDPHAADRAACHTCRRAATVRRYLVDHGVTHERVEVAGHHVGRPAIGRPAEGPPRYEVHIEGWMPPAEDETAPAPQGQGEDEATGRGGR